MAGARDRRPRASGTSRGGHPARWSRALWAVAALGLVGGGCAKVPPDRYGVGQLRIEGAKEMSAQSLRNCLATQERKHLGLTLGLETPGSCGSPPFDATPPRIELWSWPWVEWPLLDRIALERDVKRALRWYEARGFHGAEITEVRTDPPEAIDDDTLPEDPNADTEIPCDRRRRNQGCVAEITLVVEEGRPTLVEEVAVEGLDPLPEDIQRKLRREVAFEVGDRFDEAFHDRTQQAMRERLAREGYALAEVRGVARIDRDARKAWLAYAVDPGPVCRFGKVIVEGEAYLPAGPIRAAALIREGSRYDFDAVVDAQRAINALGAFSGVTVEPVLPEEGNVVDVRVEVTPARQDRFSLGVGVQAGELETLTENVSIPQWDLHLLARYENRNVFGGLRRLVLEERPRLIILERFPSFERPRFGNRLSANFRQPGLPEPRTDFIASAAHEYGPDPFDTFFRHRFDTRLALRRQFLFGKLFVQLGGVNEIYRVPPGEVRQNGEPPPADFELTFLEQILRVDLRDNPTRPHSGFLGQTTTHVSGYWLPSSWNYVRFLPDARVYVPFPGGVTWANRFALGMLFITQADGDLDDLSAGLGPRDYRLRGGGASSNRGYLPGRLGDGIEGGTRRWEASSEVRVPIGNTLGLVGFFDMGDVSRATRFRFDHPQAATGFGLRVYTLVGAIRADFAWRIPGLQVLADEDQRLREGDAEGRFLSFGNPFTFHLTIGEAF